MGPVSVADLVGLVVSCLFVIIAFAPVVFGGRTISTASKTAGTNGGAPFPGQPRLDDATDIRPDLGASAWQFEPWAEVTHRAYSDGGLPLWNPYRVPVRRWRRTCRARSSTRCCSPSTCIRPRSRGICPSIVVFVLGAGAAYVFGRVLGLGVVPAVVTSAAFSLNGWFFLYSNNGFFRAYVYLPLLFLLVELVLRSRRLLPILGLGVAVAGNIYVGMPEASLLVMGSAAAYAVARLLQERRRMPLGVSLVRLGGAGVLGLMLAAPLILLFLQYEPLSFNVHKSGSGPGAATDPQWGLLNWLVPFFGHPENRPPRRRQELVRRWCWDCGPCCDVRTCGDEAPAHVAIRRVRRRSSPQDVRVPCVRVDRAVAGRRAGRLADVRGRPSSRSRLRSSPGSVSRWCGVGTFVYGAF